MMILIDNETKVDMLNNRAIANTIVKLISESESHPISIGVHGDWGAGKSSILAMIEDQFPSKKTDTTVCIRFNGWKHQGFEDSKIALMSSILSEITRRRKMTSKAKEISQKLWKNINWISVAKTVGSVAMTAATGAPPIGMLNELVNNLKSSAEDSEKVSDAIECIGDYLSDAKVFEDISLSKEFSEFQESFESLLKTTKIKKLIILIDDLDRCLPKVTIETLEAVRLFLFSKSTAFVIAADEAMIEYAVRSYFPNYPSGNESNSGYEYSKRYLEKLIQVPFRIPVLGKVESEMYTTLLMIGSTLDESDEPGYYDLIFMDIQMPVMNGYEAAQAIRSSGREDLRSIPIIAMTANAFSDDIQKSRDAGMDDHISKPVDLGRLEEVLRKWIKQTGPEAQSSIDK